MIREQVIRPNIELTLINDQIRGNQSTIAYDSKEYVVEVIVSRFAKEQFISLLIKEHLFGNPLESVNSSNLF